MKKLFCKLGVHWMKNHHHNFIDVVNGKSVFNAECECGKKWLVDSLSALFGFRMLKGG